MKNVISLSWCQHAMFILFGLFGYSKKLTVWKLQRNDFPFDSFLFFSFLYMTFKHAISVFDFPLACSCRKCLIRLLTGRFAIIKSRFDISLFRRRPGKKFRVTLEEHSHHMFFSFTLLWLYFKNDQIFECSFYCLSLYRKDRFTVSIRHIPA